MGINVLLVNEFGASVDPSGIASNHNYPDMDLYLSGLVQHLPDMTFRLFHYIDPWGDCYFNRMQAKDLIKDIDQLVPVIEKHDVKEALLHLRTMAEKCAGQVHTYMKFIGD